MVQGAKVVVSALSFRVGVRLWLREKSGERQIRLARLLEFSGTLAQFLFVDMNSPTERTPATSGKLLVYSWSGPESIGISPSLVAV